MANYAVLLRLAVCHDYFTDNQFNRLLFAPSAQCQQIMANCGLLLRTDASGFNLLFDREKTDTLMAMGEDSELKLNLKITVTDPQYGYYSNEKIYQDAKRLTLTLPKSLDNAIEQPIEHDYLEAKALAELSEQQFGSALNNNEFIASFHLSGAQVKQLSKLEKPKVLVLQLTALKTLWQYFFIGEGFMALQKSQTQQAELPNISDTTDKVSFDPVTTVDLGNGLNALTAISTTTLPLQQVSAQHFQLCQGQQVLIRHLPVANIYQQHRRSELPVSEIYINQSIRTNQWQQ